MSATLSARPNGSGIDLEYKDKPRPATSGDASLASGSPYLPTPLEAVLLSIYPATLVLGSIFSLLNPSARAAFYDASTQSHPSHLAPSYFAQKRNLFNTLFVKIGWFWTSLAFLVFVFSHPSMGSPVASILAPRRVRAMCRWLLVTGWWIAVTQWFFGPPLMDRAFTLTGGQCELVATQPDSMSERRRLFTSAACKLAGGKWLGGYDISGHVFLLVLGGLFLWLEVLHVAGFRDDRVIAGGSGAAHNGEVRSVEVENTEREGHSEWGIGVKAVLVVILLGWWMLLMTAAYFHTWSEKLMGLIAALLGIFVVYFLPRGVLALRNFIGMPGV
ncbi:MAG: hypothetical protein M1839_000808 [Geoglossum umbratile]|nr:MAG: hypothetical protein M1839_000808 [Geoglossum umbratile]